MLRQRYGTSTLWNEGIGGETTVEGLARFDAAVAAHASRYLMLMEGTNDVIFGDISMDTTAFDLGEMSRRAVQAGVLPLLATIIPRKDWYWTTPVFQARIFDLNAKIRTRAASQKIPLVDQFNVFYYYPTTDGGWQSLILPDGVHPNPKGFDVMAAAWLDGIKILPFPPSELRLARELDKVLFAERTYNVLRWRNNPKCETDQIAGFRIYRKERLDSAAAYQLAATFSFLAPVTDYRFLDANIVPGRTYSYVITALRKDGIEGPASVMVFDIP
jgi:lysophospholipase L1-like esterase